MDHTLKLSYAGLKNIVYDKNIDVPFIFYIGEKKLKVNRFIADFLSPKISHFHFPDANINSLVIDITSFLHQFPQKAPKIIEIENNLTKLIKKLIKGEEILIKEKERNYLYFLAQELKNDEIFSNIFEFIPKDIVLDNWEIIFKQNSLLFKSTNMLTCDFVDFISENFFQLSDKIIEKYVNHEISIEMIQSILFSEKLTLESEDQLLEFIFKIKSFNDFSNNFNFVLISLLENIEFEMLSEESFQQFLEIFDYNEMTNRLWSKLCKCFHPTQLSTKFSSRSRYKSTVIPFRKESPNRFSGIIHHLTKECDGNVHVKEIVDVTSSTVNSDFYPQNAVDLKNKNSYFQTRNELNGWICYDFKEKKINPTHYSIRSRHDNDEGGWHLQTWIIEGSNEEGKWIELDSRQNEKSLDFRNAENTFEITKHLNEYFQKLRLRITGMETACEYYLTISALEYFGRLY
ncbi:hypothetical protein TRFO_22880 [Tritrichomonas foetus]|uniref:F5/8 type C domain-containing protein n=1 Tax=Tritrichomonas foetus TaxID=1144522 RepID=A0A1J4KC88_9EUKA|nr:hypothetical protein TRFO_22880 [Tritrichomonas foetus]|eukprot:OHT08544.1 hypothetical protein TRFO_22880 [Tritrichomonas foetus]